MNNNQLNNLVNDGSVQKVCSLNYHVNGVEYVIIYWNHTNMSLIVDNGNIHTPPNHMNCIAEIVHWTLNIPNESWLKFTLRSIVMGVDTEISPTADPEYYPLDQIAMMGDYIYGRFTIID